MSSRLEQIKSWFFLLTSEYCDEHGHRVFDWYETVDHVEHGVCGRCGQELYKPEFHDYISKR